MDSGCGLDIRCSASLIIKYLIISNLRERESLDRHSALRDWKDDQSETQEYCSVKLRIACDLNGRMG